MRLVTLRREDGERAAIEESAGVVRLLPHRDVGEVLASGEGWQQRARADAGPATHVAEADFAPVVPRPGKVVCVGLNYRAHVEEGGREPEPYPTLFAKFSNALIGPYADIQLPADSERMDWEAEIAVVIGARCRRVDAASAHEVIAGITAMNDVSARDWQRRTTQWLQGKTFEGTAPLGPALVTLDDMPALDGIVVRCMVNGEVVQESVSGLMLFPIRQLVEYVSRIVTLEPGDVIATGTPSGVGAAANPPRFLAEGDVVTTEVGGVGNCVNTCRAATL